MRKFLMIPVFLILFVLAFQTNAQDPKYILQNPKTYTLIKTYVVKNTGTSNATDVSAEILVGRKNIFDYQYDSSIEYQPEPKQIITDKYGNDIAKFEFSNLPAAESIEIKVIRIATSSDIEYEIDTMHLSQNKADASQYILYLRHVDKIETSAPVIVSKAQQLTEGLEDDYYKAKAIFEFVNTYMTYDESDRYRNKGAVSALTTGRGVCEDYATLFTALCRSVGIPSRVVEGYRFDRSPNALLNHQWVNADLNGHAWAEFYLKDYGWIPVEVTQIYTVNGEKQVYWEGFSALKGSQYIATGLHNPLKHDIDMTCYVDQGHENDVILEPVKHKVRLEEVTIAKPKNPSEIEKTQEIVFQDVKQNNWAYKYVNSVYGKGIIKGYSDSTFRPDKPITRIEFMVMFSRMLNFLGYQAGTNNAFTFSDYPDSHWSREEYVYLANCLEKVEPSYSGPAGRAALTRIFDSSLDINKPITREEAVALFDRFLVEYNLYETVFSDIEDSRFKSSILKAYRNELVNGYADGSFKPEDNITRSEAAKLFDTYLNMQLGNAS